MGQLEEIQVFIRVAEAGGIARAADQLGLVKSAVSRRLSELEQRLGARLINRTTRTAGLTEAGERYYQRALKLVADLAEMNGEVSSATTTATGTLRLALPLSFGLLQLTPVLERFSRLHPALKLHIDLSDRQVSLVEEGFDLAFRITDLKDSSLQARRIAPIRFMVAASPGYLNQYGHPKKPADLKQHHILHYSGSNTCWNITDPAGKLWQLNLDSSIVANNGDFLQDMAIAGKGIILQPTFLLWKALSAGDLVRLLPDCSIPSLNAYALYSRNRFLPARARLLIDYIVEQFGDNPYWDQAIQYQASE